MIDAPALAAWNARNKRARDEYALNPITSDGHLAGPCLVCGRTTSAQAGHCRRCTKDKP